MQCVPSWTLAAWLSVLVSVTMARGPPRVTAHENRRQVHKVGRTIRLSCSVEADPPPLLQWTKDGESINSAWERFKTMSAGHLKIKDLSEEDSGTYVCKATNGFGSVEVDYQIYVVPDTNDTVIPPWQKEEEEESNFFPDGNGDQIKEKPELIAPHPENTTVPYGGLASFQCKVRSVVQPHIQWLKRVDNPEDILNKNATISVKGQQFMVLQTGKVYPSKDGSYVNKLSINQVTERDAGMYICLGANSRGYSFRSAFLTVESSAGYSRNGYDVLKGEEDYEEDSGLTLPLIIAVPAAVIVIIVAAVIFLLIRRHTTNRQPSARPLSQQRIPPPPGSNANSTPTPEKQYEHYMAAYHQHPHLQPMLQPAHSHERLAKNNYAEVHSDVSIPRVHSPAVYPPPHPHHPHPHHVIHIPHPHNPQQMHEHTYYGC